MLLYLFCDGKTEDNLGQVPPTPHPDYHLCRERHYLLSSYYHHLCRHRHDLYLLGLTFSHHQMFNLFDEDGNGSINVEELLNMMAFFIEIGGSIH